MGAGGTPTEINVVMFEGRDKVSREFVTYIPESGLEVGKTYRITLTVVGTADRNTLKYRAWHGGCRKNRLHVARCRDEFLLAGFIEFR